MRCLCMVLLVGLGCASDEPNEPLPDAGPPLDAGPLGGCAPVGARDSLRCPAGCVSLEAARIDPEAACVTTERLVVACHPADALVSGDTGTQCYRHGEDESLVVRTPSITVRVEGVSDDLYADSGWVRCSDEDSSRFNESCP